MSFQSAITIQRVVYSNYSAGDIKGCFVWNKQVILASNTTIYNDATKDIFFQSSSPDTVVGDITFSENTVFATISNGSTGKNNNKNTLVNNTYSLVGYIYELVDGVFEQLEGISVENITSIVVLDTSSSISGVDTIFVSSSNLPEIIRFIKNADNKWQKDSEYTVSSTLADGLCTLSGAIDDDGKTVQLYALQCNQTERTSIFNIEYSNNTWSTSIVFPAGTNFTYVDVTVMPPFKVAFNAPCISSVFVYLF